MGVIRVPCAVCGGSAFCAVYPGTIGPGITGEGRPAGASFGSSRERAEHWPIVRCDSCGLMLANPRDDAATLADVYRAHADPAYDRELDSRQRAARDYLAVVRRYGAAKGRMLDIGCGTGAFVCLAREHGWAAQGIDASEWMIERARRRCPTGTFHGGDPLAATFDPGRLEAVTLWNILEHLSAPAAILRRARRWLVPEGRLFIRVPNGASLVARLTGRRWVLLVREHLWYFSPETMTRLVRAEGFEVVGVRSATIPASLGNVLRRIGQGSGTVAAWADRLYRSGRFDGVPLRFPIGEMDVVARPR
jgi:2-polyprenyl-3-methyl-5-hydroxy-6-metoxy-1,4-benzoquinol methylase